MEAWLRTFRQSSSSRDDDVDPTAAEFALELLRALHGYGESAPRMEELLQAISHRLGLHGAQIFSQPTGLMASFGPLERQRIHLLRVTPGTVDLGKLARVDRIATDVAHGRLSPREGAIALAHVAAAPPLYGGAPTVLALAFASGSACLLLGGGGAEAVVATISGLGLGLLDLLAARWSRLGAVFEPLAAFVVSAGAVALAHVVGPLSVPIATLAGLIVLVPGLTLTTALDELANRHLASGTARLSGALITFLSLAVGLALGSRAAAAAFGLPAAAEPSPLPWWAGLTALVVSPVCFAIILRAEPRDTPWIVAAGVIGVGAGRLGAATLGVELGAFVGAFAVALSSHAFERWRGRPAAVVLVPGLLLLVPGSVGFRGLTALMERHVLAGIESAVSALVTAVALVAGLLVAGVVAPARRLPELQRD